MKKSIDFKDGLNYNISLL